MIFFNFQFVFLFFSCGSFSFSYNPQQLDIGVWLSGASYCEKSEYNTMIFGGPASGFEYVDTLHDIKTDLQGYIGVLEKTETIYVVLRGSSSVLNWLDDFEIRQVPYTTYPECDNCKVHRGFYHSALGVSNKTLSVVSTLIKQYQSYSVIVTGHSYGASCALLLALELEKNGIRTEIYNYGQPRIGDEAFATFVNTIVPEYYRITHDKDVVPHLPPTTVFNYFHSCGEVFEDVDGNLMSCSDIICEDLNCTMKYSLIETKTSDHDIYYHHIMTCLESTVSV
jgi:hypothetical protein